MPVYNIKNVLNIDRSEVQFVINDQLFLETLLMEIRGETISLSSHKIKTQNMRELFLQNKISEIELNLNDSNKDELVNLQKELENIRNEKMNGYFIRSRANWIDNGEKITKYFCNLEKQHIASKFIPFIEKEDGSRIFDQKKILEEAKSYYEKLYSEQEHITDENSELTFDLQNCDITKLNETQKNMIEGLLQYNEVAQTLKNMNNDKSPGIDGFSTNFYKVFWGKIGHFVVRALNYAFIENSFSHNINLGTIVCIPKETKPRQFLKNLRPITLLNVLYKLASSSIANRIKSILNQLISKEQTGFLKGRFIGENTRLVYDIMQYCEERNIPGLLMLIDFEKAFDSISFRFIEKTLLFLTLARQLKKRVKMFLYNTDVCVQLNGFSSNFFTVKRGCRQGDPISAYIFILCAEILNIKLKNNIIKISKEYI